MKMPLKRRYVQLLSAALYNANLSGFATGKIYKGNIKGLCVPGLNCYSCPGAIASCPLGALQSSLTEIKYKFPLYVIGTLLIFGVLFGRAVCAFLCPFGFIQGLLHKIPSPKLKKNPVTHALTLLKYALLLIFVIALPLYFILHDGLGVPAFCKYICPAGTLEGGLPLTLANLQVRNMIDRLFWWKMSLLGLMVVSSVFAYRPFCRFVCPLGAIYSLFNRFALFGITVDRHKCNGCNLCVKYCKMDTRKINDRECLRCGGCADICPQKAVSTIYRKKTVQKDEKA